MIEFLSSWAKNLGVVIVLVSIFEMILPNNKTKKYIRVVLGIFVIFNIIAPFVKNKEKLEISSVDIDNYTLTQNNTVDKTSMNERIQELYEKELENNIKNKLQNKDINIKTSTNIISTGTEISYGVEKYTVVIYGDINGDGKINSADLLKMRQHLIGTLELKGSNKKAAALVNGNTINSADLLKLRQHLLGINNIKQ